jgi:LysM repeat protein
MDWQQLLHDKRFLYAGGVVAAVGAYALYQRKKTTGSSAASTPATTCTIYTGAGLDTTGTDVASWLGSQSGQFQDILTQFQKQLTDTLTALQKGGTTAPTPSPTPKPKPVPSPAPAPNPGGPTHGNPNPAPKSVTVAKFTSTNPAWNSTLSGIAAKEGTTVSHLLALNPGIKNPNLIYPGQSVRIG